MILVSITLVLLALVALLQANHNRLQQKQINSLASRVAQLEASPGRRAGICGNALPPTADGPITWCTLPAGHDGWHHDQVTGADWTDAAGEPSWQDQP